MARDFTLSSFRNLLTTLLAEGYSFTTVTGYSDIQQAKTIVLRHDVDASPSNSVLTALAENASGIRGTYYFRHGRRGFDLEVIRKIADLGHETGYHYEDLNLAWRRAKRGTGEEKLAAAAFDNFRSNLQKMRSIAATDTVCMHGSPLSSVDSRLMWKYFDYRELGVVAEPYLDLNVEDMLYLTDTGRRWDGRSYAIRDKAGSVSNNPGQAYKGWKVEPLPGSLMNMTTRSTRMQSLFRFRSTEEILEACFAGKLPEKIMITVHPQRWDDRAIPWLKELLAQKAKNAVKYFIVRFQ